MDKIESAVRVKTRKYEVAVSPGIELAIPDGDSRLALETSLGRTKLEIGTRYNFLAGIIRYWLAYDFPIVHASFFQLSVSDDIGVGRVYFGDKYLEHGRGVRTGVGYRLSPVQVYAGVGKTYWRLAPYDAPSTEEVGWIDCLEGRLTTGRVLPAVFGPLEPEDTSVAFHHAFRGFGGDYHFDKLEARGSWRIWSFPGGYGLRVRAQLGEAFNIRPSLPVRETFALGGAGGVKGYDFEEFRGNGVILAGAEHDWRLPWSFGWGWIDLKMERMFLLGFAEGGRIEDGWFRPADRWRWSGGVGMRLEGEVLRRYAGSLRAYVAQAEEVASRSPVFYAMLDLK